MKVVIPYTPRHIQGLIHDELDKHRWAVLVIHRRYGKTVMLVNHLIKAAMTCQKPHPRFIYMAPYAKQAKKLAWDYFKRFCDPIPGRQYNETELRVDLPNGARIYLCGADNADAHRGIYLDGCVMDEYADIDPYVFSSIIRPSLADRLGWCVFSGTPMGKNHFYDMYCHAEKNRHNGWYSLLLKASETGVIPPQELEDARAITPLEDFEREYECSFHVTSGKRIYPEFNRHIHVSHAPLIPNVPTTIYRGWDNTGLSPAIMLSYISSTGVWCLFKEFCFFDVGIKEATEALILWCNQNLPPGCTFVDYGDPAGKNRDSTKLSPRDYILMQSRDMGSDIFIQDGIQTWEVRREAVAGRLQKLINGGPAMLVDAGCAYTVMGFEGAYAYKEVVGLPGQYKKEALKNDVSHIHDAVQYIATRLFVERRADIEAVQSAYNDYMDFDDDLSTSQYAHSHSPYNRHSGRSAIAGY